jgi:serine beta-lactamase-like protein LACTB
VSKSWNRMETWLALVVLAAGAALTALLALPVYMTATSTPLHPNPQEAPSVTQWPPSGSWADAVAPARQVMRAGLAGQNLPGLSVAVGVGGEIVWAEGFGWANLEQRVPVTPDTRFRVGSASPALTSAAAGLLIEQGRLTPDAEIQAYVPDFPRKPWPVTLRHLMGHTAGLTSDGGDEGPLLSAQCDRPVEALAAFADRDLRFEPGSQYRFSNYGWILVSAAIEAAAGEPFLTFMQTRVFDPLGMHDTMPDAGTTPVEDRATPYFPRFAADPRYGVDLMRPVDHSCYAGASVFLSTPSDLVRFGMGVGRLLQPATLQRLHAAQRLPSGQDTGYGLGWDLETVDLGGRRVRMIGHDGETLGGPVASLWTFPEHGLAVAVTSNTSYADTTGLAVRVAGAFIRP